jgi:propionate CoA-transferase
MAIAAPTGQRAAQMQTERVARHMATADAVVADIQDGATILVSGSGEFGNPDVLLEALEKRFLDTGSPRDLTLAYNVFPGGLRAGTGVERLLHPGMLKRVYAGSYWSLGAVGLSDLVAANAIEAYLMPYGHLYAMLRAAASGQPGVLTRVGVGTFVDPRQGGGRITERATDDVLSVIELDGESVIYVPALHVDVAIIRATTADEDGNLSVEQEPNLMGLLALAMAASGSGGRVLAQVKQLAARGSIHPRRVSVPGIFVDEVVVAPDQMDGSPYDPALTGDLRVPTPAIEPPLDHRQVIARRAAMELRPGTLVNIGMGLSASVPGVAAVEGISDQLMLNTEHGPVGGVPNPRESFGPGINMSAVMDPPQIFDMYAAGRIDLTCLGMGEVGKDGSVNVSYVGGRHNLGGFIDIVHAASAIVFCGTFTGSGLRTTIADDGLTITHDGTTRKFLETVQQVSFDPELARARGQQVLYVTERAVFRLGPDGLVLTEIAPGIDLQRDVLDQMDFRPEISDDLAPMPVELFRTGPMGLDHQNGFQGERCS